MMGHRQHRGILVGLGLCLGLFASSPEAKPGQAPPAAGSSIADRFERSLDQYQDLTFDGLRRELGLSQGKDPPLGFEPTQVRYYDVIAHQLQLTAEERKVFSAQGFVSVDHEQRYSMASAYFAIYARDLPVLITTDSILHALHRSYDEVLKQLEVEVLAPVLREVLEGAHADLARRAPSLTGPLQASASDVDVYLAVARNLLDGGDDTSVLVSSELGEDASVKRLLGYVRSLRMQTPMDRPTLLNGGSRYVDYSQFKPRGHYTESEQLQRYFRTVMWLGRADLAFVLDTPHKDSGLEVDVERERRSAALLTLILTQSDKLKPLQGMSDIIDFMVGRSDSVTARQMHSALQATKVATAADLADLSRLAALRSALATAVPNQQQIRSQVIGSDPNNPEKVPAPQIFQPFGQRFVIDSFVLSKVVFDSILYKGQKQKRMMPSGLDVMAALGNDEAVELLRPELERHNYSANLAAARRVVEREPAGNWDESLYAIWLDSLRALDDVPANGHFPQVMRRQAWRRKQLQTQLASWAELRHDTILYAKQSYTAYPTCGYPDGYVEPYPELYAKLGRFAERASKLIGDARVSSTDPNIAARLQRVREGQVAFFARFAETMHFLERLARKELAAQPFTDIERGFLEKTIDIRGGGSGPPTYTGWYAQLIYGGEPAKWKPTVADVHTDPSSGKVLEVAVGDVEFLVAAIDNQNDRAAYVGPAYSYYEFQHPVSNRLTDPEWQRKIESGDLPSRPKWTDVFRAAPDARRLGPPHSRRADPDPRAAALQKLQQRYAETHDAVQRSRIQDEIRRAAETLERVPPKAPVAPAR